MNVTLSDELPSVKVRNVVSEKLENVSYLMVKTHVVVFSDALMASRDTLFGWNVARQIAIQVLHSLYFFYSYVVIPVNLCIQQCQHFNNL